MSTAGASAGFFSGGGGRFFSQGDIYVDGLKGESIFKCITTEYFVALQMAFHGKNITSIVDFILIQN